MSSFLKEIERILYRTLTLSIENEDIISIKQIGFRRGCGTDINLLRLRMKMQEVKSIKRVRTKSVFFIYLKAVYDTVIHSRLFAHLQEKGFDECIISNNQADLLLKQGESLEFLRYQREFRSTPMFFNIYIDSLVRDLEKFCFEVLAFSDNLADICSRETELEKVT